jgi:hypothetical protein
LLQWHTNDNKGENDIVARNRDTMKQDLYTVIKQRETDSSVAWSATRVAFKQQHDIE